MKTMYSILKRCFLLIILAVAVSNCSKDDDQEPDQSQKVEQLLTDAETTALKTTVDANTSGISNNKSVKVAVGEAVARCKKLFCARYAGIGKDSVITNEQELQMINDVLPDFTTLLSNAYTEMYKIKVKNGENPNTQAFKDSLNSAVHGIITGIKDFTPKKYVALIQNPRLREEYTMLYASVRFRLGYSEIGECYLAMIDFVKDYSYSGPFTVFYYDSDPQKGNDTEILIPITKSFDDIQFNFKGTMRTIKARVVEKTTYASYLYKGNTSTLDVAWQDFYDWSVAKGINIDFPAREIYWYEDHKILANIVTELQFAITK